MEEKFWTWYEKQGFPWSPKIFWGLPNRDTLLMGMVIRYLYEAGVAIPAKARMPEPEETKEEHYYDA